MHGVCVYAGYVFMFTWYVHMHGAIVHGVYVEGGCLHGV